MDDQEFLENPNQLAVLTSHWWKGCELKNKTNEDGTVDLWVWNGDKDVKVGEWYGGARVLRIIHQWTDLGEVDVLDRGWKGYVTFDREPGYVINEDDPCMMAWKHRFKKGDNVRITASGDESYVGRTGTVESLTPGKTYILRLDDGTEYAASDSNLELVEDTVV